MVTTAAGRIAAIYTKNQRFIEMTEVVGGLQLLTLNSVAY